ncbi:guanyl-specific ribonuclease Sa3 precursor [Cutibacterium acnes JCM 18918]|nr:guanyl-specific ribonuclease Sa3 precursor [Cutibacterium acnes JCM 18918]
MTLLAAVVVGCSTPGNVAAAGSNATTAPMTVMATTRSSVGLATIQENELLPRLGRLSSSLTPVGPSHSVGTELSTTTTVAHYLITRTAGTTSTPPPLLERRVEDRVASCAVQTLPVFWTLDHYSTFKRIVR